MSWPAWYNGRVGCTYGKPVVTIMAAEALLSPPVFAEACEAVTEERRRRMDGLRRAEDRRRLLAAGLLLRRAAFEAGLGPSVLAGLSEGAHGKPYLPEGAFHFNLSHSGLYAACAAFREEIGIDLEAAVSLSEAVKKRIFTGEERAFMRSAEAARIARRMPAAGTKEGGPENAAGICLWTVKESYLKMKGTGITVDPASVEVTPEALGDTSLECGISCRSWPGEVSHAITVWHEGVPVTVCTEERLSEVPVPRRLTPEECISNIIKGGV